MKSDNHIFSGVTAVRKLKSDGTIIEESIVLDFQKTAVVVVDMWGYHWCKTWMGRAGAMVAPFNRILAAARDVGMTVVHAPTNFVNTYAGYSQREKAAGIRDYTPPCTDNLKILPLDENLNPIRKDIPPLLKWPGDMCGSVFCCMPNYGGYALDDALILDERDYISANGQELYNICMNKGLENLIYIGGASNMCLLIKPEGLLNMTQTGLHCFLAQDLTEAYSAGSDSSELDFHTKEAADYIEQFICPSINLIKILQTAGVLEESAVIARVLICPWGLERYSQFFDESTTVTMSAPHLSEVTIRYTVDGSIPTAASLPYDAPIMIDNTAVLKAAAFRGNQIVSMVSDSYYVKFAPPLPFPDVYLSDLTPSWATLKGYVPWWNTEERRSKRSPQMDCSYDNTKLTIRGVTYQKGIGVDSPSQLVYDIKDKYDAFVSSAGVCETLLDFDLGSDEAAFPEVQFKIFVDGILLAQSIRLHISDEPWRFNLKLPNGSKKISFVTTVTTPGLSCNMASWLNPGFILKKQKD